MAIHVHMHTRDASSVLWRGTPMGELTLWRQNDGSFLLLAVGKISGNKQSWLFENEQEALTKYNLLRDRFK